MIQKVPYTCRFCGAKHVAEYDDTCPGIQVENWMKLICCNRCADFRIVRGIIMDGIAGACRLVQIGTFNGKKLPPDKEGAVRVKLEMLTKRFATLMCGSLGLANVWDSDFVNQLMEHPDKWPVVLRAYANGLRSFKTIPPSRTHADA